MGWAAFLGEALPSSATIHPGDTLFVRVWNHPELSKQVTVDSNGGVGLPLSGVVHVSGMDEAAAASKMQTAFRPYVVLPAVSVETIQQTSALFVSGGPGGVLKYQPGETLTTAVADVMQSRPVSSQAINEAGQSVTKSDGVDAAAQRARIDLRNVKVVRDAQPLGVFDTLALARQGEPGPYLQPGDTIVFAYKPIEVRVAGDVANPGPTYLSTDQTLAEAITQAGGSLPTAASNHVLLQRDGTVRSLALGNPAFQQPAHDGDVVTIPTAPRVNVVGTVDKPGLVALKSDTTLLSALYTAGGPSKRADLRNVQVVHGNEKASYDVTKLVHGDMTQNPTLQDGDTVVVPQSSRFDWSQLIGILGGIAAGLAGRVPL